MTFEVGQHIRLRGESQIVTVSGAVPQPDGAPGLRLFVTDSDGSLRQLDLTAEDAERVEVLKADASASPAEVLAGMWAAWMRHTCGSPYPSVLASSPLRPYAHQSEAVYGNMLRQPMLRFLLADEPGTGKTIMGGLWLREAQRLGHVRRALVVCPAHLVSKWQLDFERFLGGGLRRITAATAREGALSGQHDLWVVSLELAAVNPAVYEAIHPNNAGWDAVVIDEAHRMTPTAQTLWSVGQMLCHNTLRAVLMTATPHRGNELLFRSLMHLVDPAVYPVVSDVNDNQPVNKLKPGAMHFLRRMKEELVGFDGEQLFKARRADNVRVPLNAAERAYYDEALSLVDRYFPVAARSLARMVYGKRAASSLYALAETLRRRVVRIGYQSPADAAREADPEGEDEEAASEARVVNENSTDAKAERGDIAKLLSRLDDDLGRAAGVHDSAVDVAGTMTNGLAASKWPRMIDECLTPNGITAGSGEQVVIFTEYADTAHWLRERFVAAGFTARTYSGRDSHAIRDETRAQFSAGAFEVLVSTDAGNEGIDLQSAHVLVNWDIPWSLVRLEQRMGRIHRIGQGRDVRLYNIVATDTREGEAMARLLDNLVAAANELDGKIFDSLRLIAEQAFDEASVTDLAKLLGRCFDDGDAASSALEAVSRITSERLRQLHERQRSAERHLASGVELGAAHQVLHDDRLERINPHIVERFASVAAEADAITFEPSAAADSGFWLLGGRNMALPASLLPAGDEAARLVATSASAMQRAESAGVTVTTDAIVLGPGEDAFVELAEAVGEHVASALLRGAVLADPNQADDYELHVYEGQIAEGRAAPRRRCYAVKTTPAGARPAPWAVLANLTTDVPAASSDPSEVPTVPGQEHPSERGGGGGGVPREVPAAPLLPPEVEASAADAAARERNRELSRRQRRLDDWLGGAARQLRDLPNQLTDEIADRDERRALRSQLEEVTSERIKALHEASRVRVPGEMRRLGWTRVVGRGPAASPDASDSESIAIAYVVNRLSSEGFAVTDVQTEGQGYDLHARRGSEQRMVEVKGIAGSAASTGITLTGGEWVKAALQGDAYWLYVVDDCDNGGRLFGEYRDPATLFASDAVEITNVRIRGSDLAAARAGSTHAGSAEHTEGDSEAAA
ncbi:helicase-related protein [Candidatus Poriferisodalis sp.]|uniref:helicase-related protein n=1 Tax=Candidatus Poriferisodalis sp. TaxID=3101277 RepID=UPI003B02CF3B